MWPPDYSSNQYPSGLQSLRLSARCFISGNRKKSDGARSGLYGGCSKMSQWNCSRSKDCACRALCGRALWCSRTIPRESLPLRQDNLRSHRPVENEKHLASHIRRDSQSAQRWPQLYLHLPRDKVRRTTTRGKFSTSHWTPETNDRLQQNRCAGCTRKRSLFSGCHSEYTNKYQ